MSYKVCLLLFVAMCAGPSKQGCSEKEINEKIGYTYGQCINVFKDFAKCEQLVQDRRAQLAAECAE